MKHLRDDYDVLKLDASAAWLNECNARLSELPHTNEFETYRPHCTIGYLKSGSGKKYVDMLKGMQVIVIPDTIIYSKSNGEKIKEKLSEI